MRRRADAWLAHARIEAEIARQLAPVTEARDVTNRRHRDAVRQNQPAVCRLHRGITAGLLDRLDPGARLTAFVAKDPYDAGCVIELAGVRS